MERERSSDGRFRSAASYEPARGADGRFVAQRAFQVADHPAYVARHSGEAENPAMAWTSNWLSPSIGVFTALSSLPTSVASEVSGAITTAGTINAPSHSIFAAAANSLFPQMK